MKILMCFNDWSSTPDRTLLNTYGGVGYYRMIKPSEQIKDHEVKVVGRELINYGDSLQEQWDNIYKEFDAFWTCYFPDGQAASAAIYHAQKYGKKFIVDVDDQYLDVPPSNPVFDRFKRTKKDRAMLTTILSFADAITVSTEPIKERLHDHILAVHGIEKPIYVIPNMNDAKDWGKTPQSKKGNQIIVGYSGSTSHKDDLEIIKPVIKNILAKHKNVRFQIIGAMDKKDAMKYFKDYGDLAFRVDLIPATSIYKDYPQHLTNTNWDIGLAPLVDTSFTRGKSHIKWLEYSMAGIPTIASRVYPYFIDIHGKKIIEDGKTGLLCRQNEWEQAIERLILSPELRKSIVENAQKHIKETWQYDKSNINDVVNQMLSEPKK